MPFFPDISFIELAAIAFVAIGASLIGGVSGYGTGALMPLVLVPIVGAEPVVPIIALSSLFTNTSRAIAFVDGIDARRAAIILMGSVPTCVLGAYGYSLLTSKGALIVIGSMMVASVPLRRVLRMRGYRLRDGGLALAAVGWGGIVGGTSGAGILLLSMLVAAGVEGAAVIATDAVVSVVIGIVKIAMFGIAGLMTAKVIAVALLIGVVAFPGAFLAKRIVAVLPVKVHAAILDAVVVIGGGLMIVGALR